MKRVYLFVCLMICLPALLPAQKVVSLKVNGTINPASANFILRGIEKAQTEKAQCLIIQLNTPGGLLNSTRDIVSNILESSVPVVVYVSPAGAHAGSAGVFITMAANVAAMAPGTNIGAAHPVNLQSSLDSIMSEKATNDAAAFIRTIAEKRNRNLEWAEEAVRRSLSITENEALKERVVDLVAVNMNDLLTKIDGRTVETTTGEKTLQTKNAETEEIAMGTLEQFLNLISDPNIAYILFLLGLYGLMFELYSPGSILPGIVGVISLILAFYSMQTLPVNYAGVALIIFGVILFVLELKIVSHGVLAIGGVVSLLLGSLLLIRPDSNLEFIKISGSVIVSSVIVTALFFLFVIGLGLKAQRAKPVTGVSGMMGETGEALEALDPSGDILVHGERWMAESRSGKIEKGQKVRVVEMKNLKLWVEAVT